MTIQVLLADDQPGVRAGIRAVLKGAPDIGVVGEAKDGGEAQRLTEQLGPGGQHETVFCEPDRLKGYE